MPGSYSTRGVASSPFAGGARVSVFSVDVPLMEIGLTPSTSQSVTLSGCEGRLTGSEKRIFTAVPSGAAPFVSTRRASLILGPTMSMGTGFEVAVVSRPSFASRATTMSRTRPSWQVGNFPAGSFPIDGI
jgi:hypothetical protein